MDRRIGHDQAVGPRAPGRQLAALSMCAATAALALSACTDKPTRDPDVSQRRTDSLQVDTAQEVEPPEACTPVWPEPVVLSGILREETRLGPPGYGETPRIDERIKLLLLELEVPIDVCRDPAIDAPQHIAKGVKVVQLAGAIDPDSPALGRGRPLVVYGQLRRQVMSKDFTEAILEVDSVPALRAHPRKVT